MIANNSRSTPGAVGLLSRCRMRHLVVFAGALLLVSVLATRTMAPARGEAAPTLRTVPQSGPGQQYAADAGFASPAPAYPGGAGGPAYAGAAPGYAAPGSAAPAAPGYAPPAYTGAPTASAPPAYATAPAGPATPGYAPAAPAPAAFAAPPAATSPAAALPGISLLNKLQANKGMTTRQRIDRAKQGLSDDCKSMIELASNNKRPKGGHKYYSQFFQDAFFHLNFYYDNPRDGFFLDVGANEPITGSNSYFFEKCLGWKGLLFEGMPSYIKKLQAQRKMELVPKCALDHEDTIEMISSGVCSYIGEANQLQKSRAGSGRKSQVPCGRVGDELRKRGIKHVDIMSLDIEGSEIWALEGIYWDEVQIDFIVAENNFGDDYVRSFLMPRGYMQIAQLWPDEVFMYIGHYPPMLKGGGDIYLTGAAEHMAAERLRYAHNVIKQGKMPAKVHSDTLRNNRESRRRKYGIKATHGNM